MNITIGGNRVGSGKKMHTAIDNYGRSTHNLNTTRTTTAASGILYPLWSRVGLRGDNFKIRLAADCRTIPTKGPLFGSYKLQVDVFQVPLRLYQAILHNNPTRIGMNMHNVLLPQLRITETNVKSVKQAGKFANNCLLKYLGMSGIGKCTEEVKDYTEYYRDIDATKVLAYYDIFKNYYANKQEEKAYVLSGARTEPYTIFITNGSQYTKDDGEHETSSELQANTEYNINDVANYGYTIEVLYTQNFYERDENIYVGATQEAARKCPVVLIDTNNNRYTITIGEATEWIQNNTGANRWHWSLIDGELTITIAQNQTCLWKGGAVIAKIMFLNSYMDAKDDVELTQFDLKNIDDMRYDILSHHALGTAFTIDQSHYHYLPYSLLVDQNTDNTTKNRNRMNGLVLKTYQNDIYNNWLDKEWIEGQNGITEMTKVAIVDGAFSMDSLNFATKLYTMLNRIALTDGTYEDWQDVVYEQVKRKAIETPIFIGGMSKEIVFDEVVQNAPADGDPLGTLGGRGRSAANSQKGGTMVVKCDEACIIMAIASITPRINYSQGNDFYMTDVKSIDDLHKPEMDQIGFQDLIGERMAWFDTNLNGVGEAIRHSMGKLPAWIEYMTDVDQVFGDFAEINEEEDKNVAYMVLNRNYELKETDGVYSIKDPTTYIDPSKYNYAFAYTALDAQNFWLQVAFNVEARRLMSARLIPNV